MLRFTSAVAAISVTCSQYALADPDVSGRWSGSMVCPGGNEVQYSIDVAGKTATFTQTWYADGSQRKPETQPVKVSTDTGREGEWVYFTAAKYSDGANLNGLLARDGRSIHVRRKTVLGECRPFVLIRTAASTEMDASIKELAKPPNQRAPSEPEMRAAVDDRVQEEAAPAYAATPLNRVKVSYFKKLGCLPLPNKQYTCQYSMTIGAVQLPLGNDRDARGHAAVINAINDAAGSVPIDPYNHTAAFSYDEATKRWIRSKEPKLNIVRSGQGPSDSRRR